MNADYYLKNIIVEDVMPFAPFVSPNFLLIQVKARTLMTEQIIDYLNIAVVVSIKEVFIYLKSG